MKKNLLLQLDQLIADFPLINKSSSKSIIKSTIKPSVAISACLNGEVVRYDGQQKSLDTKTVLNHYLHLTNICPEVGAGMPVPRPPIQLVQYSAQDFEKKSKQYLSEHTQTIHVVERDNPQRDVSKALQAFSQKSLQQLDSKTVAYVLKSKSPSCGIQSTPVFNSQRETIAIGSGIQADYFIRNAPTLLLVDETKLITEEQCASFIFSCIVLSDFFNSEESLTFKHKHYHFLIRLFLDQQQKILNQLSAHNQANDYKIHFKQGIEDLINRKNLGQIKKLLSL